MVSMHNTCVAPCSIHSTSLSLIYYHRVTAKIVFLLFFSGRTNKLYGPTYTAVRKLRTNLCLLESHSDQAGLSSPEGQNQNLTQARIRQRFTKSADNYIIYYCGRPLNSNYLFII